LTGRIELHIILFCQYGGASVDEHIRQRILLSRFFDIYEPMLTSRQSKAFRLHFLDDWSLSEVAGRLEVSRQGAHDLVQRARERLLEVEELLGFSKREDSWEKCISDLGSWADKYSGDIPAEAAAQLYALLASEGRGAEEN